LEDETASRMRGRFAWRDGMARLLGAFTWRGYLARPFQARACRASEGASKAGFESQTAKSSARKRLRSRDAMEASELWVRGDGAPGSAGPFLSMPHGFHRAAASRRTVSSV
jgi:hypothetical protein